MPASAPWLLHTASFSSLDAQAMTRAPSALPLLIAATPAPPGAPPARRAGVAARAGPLAVCDRGNPAPAGRTQDEQRFAGLEPAAVAQRVVRGAVGEEEGGAAREIHPFGQRQ